MFFQHPKKKEPETPLGAAFLLAFYDVAGTASCWGACAQAHAHRPVRTGSCARAHALLESMFLWSPCSPGVHVPPESMFFWNPCSSTTLRKKNLKPPLAQRFCLFLRCCRHCRLLGCMRTGSCAQAHALLESMFLWNPRSPGTHVLLEPMLFWNPCSSGIHVLLAP